MGGAVGHLMHLYDNRELKFCEIESIIRSAADGKLENATEKLDGLNLVFSWDVSNNSLKVARSNGDIKRGGMDARTLASKFTGRGNLTSAFTSAFKVLNGAIGSLPENTKCRVFGESANRWYSIEVIYSKNPNVINYNSNNVVFHGWPMFEVEDGGNVLMTEDVVGGIDTLTEYVDKMQRAVQVKGWKIRGPAIAKLKKLSDGTIAETTISRIYEQLMGLGLSPSATIGDYLRTKMTYDVEALALPRKVSEAMVNRCMGEIGSPTLVDIRKMADKSDHIAITEFVKNSSRRLKEYIKPVEHAINDFALELLRGYESTLVDDTHAEVLRLRREVVNAINAIRESGDENAMSILNTQMQKLKSVENITSASEGIVFIFKENVYKFTGSFASVGQILGLFKYGRKGTKL